MQSDIVDVVGITPVPSPLPSSEGLDNIKSEYEDHSTPRGTIIEDKAGISATVEGGPATEDDLASSASVVSGGIAEENSRIRCICQNEEDDGFTIQCDNCLIWQHAICVGIVRNSVPEVYLCDECRPESGARKGRRPTREVHSLPVLNEISGNIVGAEVMDMLQCYSKEYERIKLRMPSINQDTHLGLVNFELNETAIALPDLTTMRSSMKRTEVRDLKLKNYGKRAGQVARMGVFAEEDIDPGTIIGEYLGHVQLASNLLRGGGGRGGSSDGRIIESVSQSYVLFSGTTPGVVVDARKFGCHLRYVRRSCRGNCHVKLVILPPESTKEVAEQIHWCLFARNTIREGEELFLPFDYEEGNHLFRYECCCLYPELCLADEMPMFEDISKEKNSTLSVDEEVAIDSSSDLGFGRVGSPFRPRSINKVVANSANTTTKSRQSTKNPPDRKLTREERKLQQYIEYIERMEQAERKSAERKSNSGAASPPVSRRGRGKSLQTSPNRESDRKVNGADVNMSTNNISSPVKSNTLSPSKKMMPLKKFLSKTLGSDRSSTTGSSSLDSPAKKDLVAFSLFNKEDADVDIVGGSEIPSTSSIADVDQGSGRQQSTSSNQETPSKKRVSLSDYLLRRKSSPLHPFIPNVVGTSSLDKIDPGLEEVAGGGSKDDREDHAKNEPIFAIPSPVLNDHHRTSHHPDQQQQPRASNPQPVLPTRYTTPPPPLFTSEYHSPYAIPPYEQSYQRARWSSIPHSSPSSSTATGSMPFAQSPLHRGTHYREYSHHRDWSREQKEEHTKSSSHQRRYEDRDSGNRSQSREKMNSNDNNMGEGSHRDNHRPRECFNHEIPLSEGYRHEQYQRYNQPSGYQGSSYNHNPHYYHRERDSYSRHNHQQQRRSPYRPQDNGYQDRH